jgi:hypothetical protein
VHDPDVVVWEIRRPWPSRSTLPAAYGDVRWRFRLHHDHHEDCHCPSEAHNPFPWYAPHSYSAFWRMAGRDYYWPPIVTMWHREPHGRDALSECQRRYRGKDGRWHLSKGWKWHVHHYRVQIPPLQHLRRRLLTRCAWCGGRDAKGNSVNHSLSWDGPRGHWWHGEPGLYHGGCTDRAIADHTCTCDDPLIRGRSEYGKCMLCGRFRPWGLTAERIEQARALQAEGRPS